MDKEGFYDFFEIQDEAERWQSIQLEEMYKVIRSTESMIMKDMLSDEVCTEVIDEYYYKIIKKAITIHLMLPKGL